MHLLADESHVAGALEDAGLVELVVHFLQESHLVCKRDLEGVDGARALKFRLDEILLGKADGEGDPFGGQAGICESLIEQLGEVAQIGGGGKTPGAAVEHADAHAAFAGGAGALEVPVPHHQIIGFFVGVPAGVHVIGAQPLNAFDVLLDLVEHAVSPCSGVGVIRNFCGRSLLKV